MRPSFLSSLGLLELAELVFTSGFQITIVHCVCLCAFVCVSVTLLLLFHNTEFTSIISGGTFYHTQNTLLDRYSSPKNKN